MDVGPSSSPLLSLLIYTTAAVGAVVALLLLSWLSGGRHSSPDRDKPFESGVEPVARARLRLSAKFYLIAMFFVIFDLEAVYLFAWAIALEASGWAGFIEATVFVSILLAALLYLWRLGGLDWAPRRDREPARHTPAMEE